MALLSSSAVIHPDGQRGQSNMNYEEFKLRAEDPESIVKSVNTINEKTYVVEWKDGTKHWYQNGKFHREDGPSVEYLNGTKCWCLNGKLHREDGPAVEGADGSKYWYINGQRLAEEEFDEKRKEGAT